jgi:hypothetical protein
LLIYLLVRINKLEKQLRNLGAPAAVAASATPFGGNVANAPAYGAPAGASGHYEKQVSPASGAAEIDDRNLAAQLE